MNNHAQVSTCSVGGLKLDERLLALILTPRGSNHFVLTEEDLVYIFCITKKIKINWIHIIKEHMQKAMRLGDYHYPYAVLISKFLLYFCSVRLTWDVFVRNLNRQLGTPSQWLPVDSCKEGQKGALAAVCTPTLKSASKKHQKLCTSVSEHHVWHSEGGKKETVCSVYFLPLAKIFPQSLVRNLKARASN